MPSDRDASSATTPQREVLPFDAPHALDDVHLRLALEAGGLGTWVWDIEHGHISWSEGLELLHGLAPGAFEGTFEAFQRDLHPEDRDRMLAHIQRVVDGEREHEIEYRIVRPDKAVRWVETRGQLIRDEDGRPARLLGVCKDITAQRADHERREFLREATAILSSSLDTETTLQRIAALAVPRLADWCAIDLCDDDGGLRRVAVVHSDPEKLRFAEAIRERYPPDPNSEVGPPQVVRSGASELMEHIPDELLAASAEDEAHLEALRELGLYSYIAAPLSAEGKVFGVLTLVTAESERALTRDDLETAEALCNAAGMALLNARLYGEMRRAVRVRDDLLAVVSHDMRNALQVITVETALLRGDFDGAEADALEGVETMYDAARQMKRLIDDLLDLASIDAGQLSMERSTQDPAAIASRAAEMCEALAAEKQVELRVEIAPNTPPISGDADRLLQVFLNLVGNALKYTEAGGSITVGVGVEGKGARFWVSDTGCGIPEAELACVFDRYGRGQDTRGARSVGLGLYISRGIISAHHGEIDLESVEGEGTTVWFTVPSEPQR